MKSFKNQLIKIAIILLATSVQTSYADVGDIFYGETTEGIRMKFCVTNEDSKECEVYGKGNISNFYTAISATTEGTITIPSEAKGYKVTGIATFAFAQCELITSVTIPENITSIKSYSFRDCI